MISSKSSGFPLLLYKIIVLFFHAGCIFHLYSSFFYTNFKMTLKKSNFVEIKKAYCKKRLYSLCCCFFLFEINKCKILLLNFFNIWRNFLDFSKRSHPISDYLFRYLFLKITNFNAIYFK